MDGQTSPKNCLLSWHLNLSHNRGCSNTLTSLGFLFPYLFFEVYTFNIIGKKSGPIQVQFQNKGRYTSLYIKVEPVKINHNKHLDQYHDIEQNASLE